jgi:hypothetical protein
MADDVAKLLIQVSATTELLRSNLAKAERAVGDFERDTNRKLSKVDGHFSKLGGGVGKIKASLAGFTTGAFGGFLASLSVGAVTSAIRNSLEFAGSLGEVAQSLGVSTKFLQEFRYAATQNGATLEQADNALGKFSVTLGKAFSSGQSAAIKQLGLNLDELKRASDSERYAAVAAAIAKIPDPAQRASAAVAIFGKGATAIIPTLEAGAEGFRKQAKEAREFGLVLSDKQIQDADKTADKIDRLTSALGTRFAGVVADNADQIGNFAESIANLVDKIIGFEKYYPRFAAAIKSFSPISGGLIGSAIRSDGLFADAAPAPKLRSRPARNADFLKTSTPSSLGNGANFLNASPGRLGAGGALALSGIDFGAVLDQLQQATPLMASFATESRQAALSVADIGKEGAAMLDDLRESNRIALLRAEGRDADANAAESLRRVSDDVNRIEGLTVAQRAKLLAQMQQLTIEGQRQVESAQQRLNLEQDYQDTLAERVANNTASIMEGITANVNNELDDYRARGAETQRYLADTFETLFTQGSGGLWRQFKYEGLRAVSEVLAKLISGSSGFGGGGGGGFFGSLFSAVGSIFGGGGSLGKSTANILGRATGGPVNAGQPYIVGEKRPELFVPRTPGSIVPSLKGMGGQAINLTVNAPGATAETVALIRRELANAAPTIAAAASNMTMRNISRPRL